VAVILDGASPEEVERLKRELHEDVVVIPDPSGAIAARFGIHAWPTSVTVEQGVVTSVDVGAEIGGQPPDSEAAS
jgi:hypothetical protein